MKLILALSLLIGMEAAGQIKIDRHNAIPNNYGNVGDTGRTVFATPSSDSFYFYSKPHYDTVRVVILYCDTTIHEWRYDDSISFLVERAYAKWQYGYEVRELGTKGDIINNFDGTAYVWPYQPIRHVAYLDDRRKPLAKSIIVWQSIKL